MTSALVAGAGVVGLSIARELARRGHRVTVVDPDEPGEHGPSAAESRILRCSYGARSQYTELTWQSVRRWRELERESGQQLLIPSGVLGFASRGTSTGWEERSLAVLRGLRIPVERLSPREVARRFPTTGTEDLVFALYEPEAGVLRARRAVRALAASCRALGCELVRGEARPAGTGVLVDGTEHRAPLVVWAVGAALPGLFPELACGRPADQVSYYLDSPALPCGPTGPAWLDQGRAMYGIGALSGTGVKVVPDTEAPPGARPTAPFELPESARAYLRLRFPALAGAPVLSAETCTYTTTENEEFVLGRHPAAPSVWLVGGDSGHGFKNAPTWGSYVCDVLEGKASPHPRWRLRPKAATR
ncbi:NAD(P)/FAD-dependent oxidoreductase [Kitasatospora sp. NPDC048407]|uniref:NAD(P)/FAD-dependent oxidoreductase n=1 Tax=Kitasatospora sp. NPDC048407 TaxID=3364051 RepID=UPI00371FFEA0